MNCERLKCKTSVETCINRQHVATPARFSQCVDCPQGKKVVADFKRQGKKPEPDIEKLKAKVAATINHRNAPTAFLPLNQPMTMEEIEEAMEKKPKEKEAPQQGEEKASKATLKLPEGSPEGIVTVDFRRRPEVFKWLQQMAEEDERTIEKELLYLARECREEWQKKQEKAA